jgi:hypothetical protein
MRFKVQTPMPNKRKHLQEHKSRVAFRKAESFFYTCNFPEFTSWVSSEMRNEGSYQLP